MNTSAPHENRTPGAVPVVVCLVLAVRTVCEALSAELEAFGINVAGFCTTAGEAVQLIPLLTPRIAVLDTRLPDGTGYRLCRQARALAPALQVLLLSSYDDGISRRAAVLAGAHALVPRQIHGAPLAQAIHRLAAGEDLIGAEQRKEVIDDLSDSVRPDGRSSPGWARRLDAPQRSVLCLAAEGLSDRAISRRLGMSEQAVASCFDAALQKVGH